MINLKHSHWSFLLINPGKKKAFPYSSWSSPNGNQEIGKSIINKIAIWFDWNIIFFREMNDFLLQTKKVGNYGVFVSLKMQFLLLSYLFRMDIGWSIDIGLNNKFLNRKKVIKEILALINCYIGTHNIHYVDGVVKKREKKRKDDKEDNNDNKS